MKVRKEVEKENFFSQTPEGAYKFVKAWQDVIYPDVFDDYTLMVKQQPSKHTNYIFFSPAWFFRPDDAGFSFLNQHILRDLKSGKTMLSLASGPAYLEDFLVQAFGIYKKQIVLSDVDTRRIPSGYKKYRFNYYDEWPEFADKFDYIIFPESVFIFGNSEVNEQQRIDQFAKALEKALSCLKSQGEIRASYVGERCFSGYEPDPALVVKYGEFESKRKLTGLKAILEGNHKDVEVSLTGNILVVKKK